MKRRLRSDFEELAQQRGLLAALSDDLSLPLLQIKSAVELIEQKPFSPKSSQGHIKTLALSAQSGLQLIEAYRLALRAHEAEALPLEPVAVGAVLQEVAHQLTPYAKQYATTLDINTQGRLTPVLAHKASLEAALQCLGASIIRAQASEKRLKNYQVLLAAHRGSGNLISTGVFSNMQGLSDRTLRSARGLVGKARQPLNNVPAGAASGVLIADMLCSAMWQPLRAAAHQGMHGLATAVPVSKQLHFV